MNQIQFLILAIAAIPLLNCLLLKLYQNDFISKFCAILFFSCVFGAYSKLGEKASYLALIKIFPDISLGFFIDRIAVGFLFLLSFIWIILSFYTQRFLQFNLVKHEHNFRIFFTLTIAFATLAILSKNLLTLLLFYNFLILLSYFFLISFLHKSDTKFPRFFVFLLYLESVFFFLAIVATYKFSASIEFAGNELIADNFDLVQYRLLFLLFCFGLFLSLLAPFYLLYRNLINVEPLFLYVFFFLSYALISLMIFIRIICAIFGTKGFALLLGNSGFGFFEILFLCNMFLASIFLASSKGIKTSFFYLFFQQFTFTLFAIFLFEKFAPAKAYLALLSFALSFTLCFLAISNLVLYLNRAQNKALDGLFYPLIITCSLLIFSLASMAGIAPALGLIEKFSLLKIIIAKKLPLSLAIIFLNFLGVAIFSFKIFLPLLRKKSEDFLEDDLRIAKNIDFDSSLVLTGLIVAIFMFFGLIFSPLITNFFSPL
jgi:multicomponent Na+:H+ antiporter subunit D